MGFEADGKSKRVGGVRGDLVLFVRDESPPPWGSKSKVWVAVHTFFHSIKPATKSMARLFTLRQTNSVSMSMFCRTSFCSSTGNTAKLPSRGAVLSSMSIAWRPLSSGQCLARMLLLIARHGCRGCTRPSASMKERLRQLGAMVVVDKCEVLECWKAR